MNYSYDARGYASAITVNPVSTNGVGVNTGSTLGILSAITYNADNNLKGWTWQDGSAKVYSFDAYGILSGYNLGFTTGTGTAAGATRTLTRDAASRITGYVHTNNGSSIASLDQTFTYDNLNRLLSANLNGTATQYSFDANGNRLTKVVGGTTYTNTISATSNRVTQIGDVGGPFTVSYDSSGSITGDGTNTYTYSDGGRMASATNAGGTVNYKYNALNQRVSKIGPTAMVPTGAAYYVYDEIGQLLGEYDANGAPNYARYADILSGQNVPGILLPDAGHKPLQSIVVPTTTDADYAMREFQNLLKKRPGSYNLVSNQCTAVVSDTLRAGGIDCGRPKKLATLIKSLQDGECKR